MKRDRAPGDEPAPDSGATTVAEPERVVRCRRCDATITRSDEAIVVAGKHAHRFVNPSGIAFDVRCFREAPGATPFGVASTFFSWFADHVWRIAVCGACGTHLGWRFENGGSMFHGLIVERIVEGA
jgi:hypothetical protein